MFNSCNHIQCANPAFYAFPQSTATLRMCFKHCLPGMEKINGWDVLEKARSVSLYRKLQHKHKSMNEIIESIQTTYHFSVTRFQLFRWHKLLTDEDISVAKKHPRIARKYQRLTWFRSEIAGLPVPTPSINSAGRFRTRPARLGNETTVVLPPVKTYGGLHSCGWEVWIGKFKIHEDTVRYFQANIPKFTAIFNINNGRKAWSHVLSGTNPPESLIGLIEGMQLFVEEELKDVTTAKIENVNSIVCLLSSPKVDSQGQVVEEVLQQWRHIDYEYDDRMKQAIIDGDKFVPLSMIVALEDNTKITVWSGSHRVLQDPNSHAFRNLRLVAQTIYLGKGDCFLFRGDLVHIGEGSAVQNFRLFAYVETAHVHRYRGASVYPTTYWIHKHYDPKVSEILVPLPQEEAWLAGEFGNLFKG